MATAREDTDIDQDIYNSGYIKGLFDRMSASYDRVNYIFSFGFSRRWRKQFLARLSPAPGDLQVIDLMTGMGEMWKHIFTRFPGADLYALDFSTGMLKYAREKNKHFGNKTKLLEEDLLDSKLPDEGFDIVICAFGLKTFNNEQLNVIAALTRRILKQGGQFAFIEVSKPSNRILHFLYKLHLKNIVPVAGKLVQGSPKEYRMLWRYTNIFRDAREAAKIFADAGLNVSYDSYFSGCATGIHGYKLE